MDLVSSKLRFPPDQSILQRMKYHFTAQCTYVVQTNDADMAKGIYDLASQLPSTATNAALTIDGINIVDRCTKSERVVIMFGHRGLDAIALKRMFNRDEVERLQHLSTLNLSHRSIISFQLIQNASFLCMPRIHSDLVELKPLGTDRQEKLYDDLVSALRYLHELKISHMDIKPSNIGLDTHSHNFVLYDIGNAVPFDVCTDVTELFVPSDFSINHGQMAGSPQVDFWLLVTSFLSKLLPGGLTVRMTKRQIIQSLSDNTDTWVIAKRLMELVDAAQ